MSSSGSFGGGGANPVDVNRWSEGHLPGLLGIRIDETEPGRVVARLEVRTHHLAPNGYLHAATIIALADTCAGYGTMISRPDRAVGFTTIELTTNFLATADQGVVRCEARLDHGGRTTQVWSAEVTAESETRRLALFRCTQLLIYPR